MYNEIDCGCGQEPSWALDQSHVYMFGKDESS
jgi:hypothetical protein